MVRYIDRGPNLFIQDPLRPGECKVIKNPNWSGYPEIISFTDFLRWNYEADYGLYIRDMYRYYKSTNDDSVFALRKDQYITNVYIYSGEYDRVDEDSFNMYIVCGVDFSDADGHVDTAYYTVSGIHRENGTCYYYGDIELYRPYIRKFRNRLDEYLVPIISKKEYDRIAYEILTKYYSDDFGVDYRIDVIKLAEQLGFKVVEVKFSNNTVIRAKTIYHGKEVTIYENGKRVKRYFESGTILVQGGDTTRMRRAVIHECIHIYLHKLFYTLQSRYRSVIGIEAPEFSDYMYSYASQTSVNWMEIQADTIAPHILMYTEHLDDVISEFTDEFGNTPNDFGFQNWNGLISHVSFVFGTSIHAAKKRLLEKGFWRTRGVLEYNGQSYCEQYFVPESFPKDYTYTLSLEDMAKICGKNAEFDKLIRSEYIVYADGHLCLNFPEFVYTDDDKYKLTGYAKMHMDECCASFKRVYGHKSYRYTFGELNAVIPDNMDIEFDDEELARIEASEKKHRENMRLLAKLYVGEGDNKRPMTRGETAKFHMAERKFSVERLKGCTGLGTETISKIRSKASVIKIKPESVLAFAVGLHLETVYREDILVKSDVMDKFDPELYNFYLMILKAVPNATVFKINNLLIKRNMVPWTKGEKDIQAAI